jgi:hypothetical protein
VMLDGTIAVTTAMVLGGTIGVSVSAGGAA